eukprot:TRINITY_DN3015_c0_g1_i2.p1 TRINITY_DN3015_c0_g1~~TRINITY_DN3015_c0_g1_i2.p1  ORF type:complete len:522 (-),score=85.86 TRINITY_DN3015_c0_g1_i2:317-1882(-)
MEPEITVEKIHSQLYQKTREFELLRHSLSEQQQLYQQCYLFTQQICTELSKQVLYNEKILSLFEEFIDTQPLPLQTQAKYSLEKAKLSLLPDTKPFDSSSLQFLQYTLQKLSPVNYISNIGEEVQVRKRVHLDPEFLSNPLLQRHEPKQASSSHVTPNFIDLQKLNNHPLIRPTGFAKTTLSVQSTPQSAHVSVGSVNTTHHPQPDGTSALSSLLPNLHQPSLYVSPPSSSHPTPTPPYLSSPSSPNTYSHPTTTTSATATTTNIPAYSSDDPVVEGNIEVFNDILDRTGLPRNTRLVDTLADDSIVSALTFDNTGSHLVTAGKGSVKIWDLRHVSHVPRAEFKCFENSFGRSLKISSDGCSLITGGENRQLGVWSLDETGCGIPSLKNSYETTSACFGLALGRDPSTFFSGHSDGLINFWDTRTKSATRVFEGHHESVSSIELSPDGYKLVSGGLDGSIRVWEISTGRQIGYYPVGEQVFSLAICPGESWIAMGFFSFFLKIEFNELTNSNFQKVREQTP